MLGLWFWWFSKFSVVIWIELFDTGVDVKLSFYCQWLFLYMYKTLCWLDLWIFVSISFPLLITWLLFKLSPITQLGPVLSQMQSNCLDRSFYLSCCFVILMYTREMQGIDFCWPFAVTCLEFILNRLGCCHPILPTWSMKFWSWKGPLAKN